MTNLDFKLLVDKIDLEEHRYKFQSVLLGSYFIDNFRTELNDKYYYLVIDFLVNGDIDQDGFNFKGLEIEFISLLKNEIEQPIKDSQHKQLINKLEQLIKEL